MEKDITLRDELIRHLAEDTHVLDNELIREAFRVVDRADFVPADYKIEAYEDYPLPIGDGQTISQPTTVAFMLEKLDVAVGQRVLDIGTGSGWTVALLATMVGPDGFVYGTERIPALLSLGKTNLQKYDFKNIALEPAGKEIGLPDRAPFDRILVSASTDSEKIVTILTDMLDVGGVLVMPFRDQIIVVKRGEDGEIERDEFDGFSFVPLITQ